MSSPGLAGVTIELASGQAVALDRAPGGLRAMRRDRDGTERVVDRHGRLSRRGRNPRRGGPPSAAARSHLSSRAEIGRGDGGLVEIRVEENPAAVVAEMLVEAAERGSHIVLTGGSTPKLAYEIASRDGRELERVDGVVQRRALRAARERAVELPDGERRAAGPASRATSGRRSCGWRASSGPDAGAASYEALGARAAGRRAALGPAAARARARTRTARRCFPASPRSRSAQRLVTGVELAGMEPQVPRISLTLPAIASARRIVFLVTGSRQGEGRRPRVRRPARSDLTRRARAADRGRAARDARPGRGEGARDERSVHRRRRRRDQDRGRGARGRRALRVARSSPTNQASQDALVEQIAVAIEGSVTRRDARRSASACRR